MQSRTRINLTLRWSLAYLIAWLACAALLIPLCIHLAGLSLSAGLLHTLWTTPHLPLLLIACPLPLITCLSLGQLHQILKSTLRCHY